ncbi:MAG TPA: DEAD/DEAH box helicase [Burkholderiales bacterium]|nr:DEAD/DEAH box helicase [Burkholderiales bacterium]
MANYTLRDVERNLDRLFVERGRSYVAEGRVSELAPGEGRDTLTGLVQGTAYDPYKVSIQVVAGNTGANIYGVCSCPMHVNCKHVAAVLLANLHDGGRTLSEQRRLARRGGADISAPHVAIPPIPAQKLAPPSVRNEIEPIPNALQAWLNRVKQSGEARADATSATSRSPTRLLYLLRLDPYFAGRRLVVQTVTARLLKSGGYSAPRSWSNARAAVHQPAGFVTPEDVRMLRLLLIDAPNAYGDSFHLAGSNASDLLRELVATGRCFWAEPQGDPLRLGAPRPGAMRWQFDPMGAQHIAIDTAPDSSTFLPIAPPWYIDLAHGQCGPIELAVPPETAELLANVPPVAPNQVELVRTSLKSLESAESLPLPSVPSQEERTAKTVTPCLHFASFVIYGMRSFRSNPLGEILDVATLTFDYDGVTVTRDSPSITTTFRDGKILRMPRAPKIEKAAHVRLEQCGFAHAMYGVHAVPSEHKHDYVLGNANEWLQFIGAELPKLEREGWRIEFDENFRFRLAQMSEWSAHVEPTGRDWFDFRIEAQIDGKQSDLMPIVLGAMRNEPKLVAALGDAKYGDDEHVLIKLQDGRLLPVPIGRLRGVFTVLHELLDAPVARSARLSRLDAARLAHLEAKAGLRWQGGEEVRALGKRLAQFEGIEPVAPPQDFGASLRPYQADGLSWLQFLRKFDLNGILADDMGLGKTVQALAHILLEKQAGRLDCPALVVAPTSVLPNWRAEAQRFAPQLRVHVSHGLERKSSFDQLAGADIVLTTYPLLLRDKEVLLKETFHLVILDEAQVIKNAQTQAARIVSSLKARHRLCMTGTPLENHLGELWSLFHFLMPGFLGDTQAFRRAYRTPIEKHSDQLRRESLARRIKPFILRRTKEQVAAELPAKSEMLRSVELGAAQRDLYETVRLSMHERVRAEIAARGLQQSHIIVLDALLKLRQICCDPRLLKIDAAKKVKESAKLQLLMEMLPELLDEGRKVLLFSQFTSMLALVEEQLNAQGIRYVKLTGETKNRAQPVKAFQNGEVDLFLISLKAGGTGLNLTAADTVIHYDPWWNPAVENQATDRAHRIGQDKPVFVYKLIVAGSVEEKISALQQSKAELAASLLDGAEKGGAALTAEDIAALFEPMT